MSIPAKRIGKVIIAGQWFTVLPGSFQVVDMDFEDENGNVMASGVATKGYTFLTDNRDEYYGPLSSIELFKLVNY